jgi:AcrR family transcriptional regulator
VNWNDDVATRKQTIDAREALGHAFALIAERGWARFSFAALAERAGVGVAHVYALFPDRAALLRALAAEADRGMLTAASADLADSPAKDRLFELIMSRLDALKPYKPGLQALARGARRDPLVPATTACSVHRGIGWMMDAAGLERAGLRGCLTRRVLGLAYLQIVRVWLGDDSEDAAKAMAEADRRLGQLAQFPGWSERRPAAA